MGGTTRPLFANSERSGVDVAGVWSGFEKNTPYGLPHRASNRWARPQPYL